MQVNSTYYQAPIYNAPAAFQLKEELGSGEKGVVHLAEDSSGQQYALKVYRTASELIARGYPAEVIPYYFDEQGRSRLAQTECELGQVLTHPAFVKIYGTTVIDGRSALIMEYIDGGLISKSDAKHDHSAFEAAIEGLLFALERGYKSCDLSDDNAMIDSHGQFKFIDIDSFEKVEDNGVKDRVKNSLESHQYFLSDLLNREDSNRLSEFSKTYFNTIKNQLKDNVTPANLSLVIDYLIGVKNHFLISSTSREAP
jgi:serine/threonine protein kinase